jgi:predicted Ser/Thr protein kinase
LDALLATPEEMAEVRRAAAEDSEADLQAILGAGAVPPFPQAELRDGQVLLPNGLRLPAPRDSRYLARLGPYDVVSILGEGGMGLVLKAFEEALRREVALKVMGPRWLHDPAARERFVREAQAAARLVHPNIITIHAVSRDEPPFIVMEYVRGKSLALSIAEEGRLEPARAADIARQVLAALDHAHRQGIVHRDVKPGNILLEAETLRVKLVDFGLARGVSDAVRNTAEGSVMGTPWYMSPEQASGAMDSDPRSDLYSLGVVLFEMVAGTLPFPGQDVQQVLKRICSEATPDPCLLNPAVSRQLAAVIVRALEKDRSRRYQSAAEFAAAIDAYSAGGHDPEPADQPVRCPVCRAEILSKAGAKARVCQTCGAPICWKCWGSGVRHCKTHATGTPAAIPAPLVLVQATPPEAAAPPAPECETPGNVLHAKGSAIPENSREASPLPQPAASPAAAGDLSDKQVSPNRNEEIQATIARARAEGRPVVTAAEARLAEATFFRLMENSLAPVSEVLDPHRGVAIAVKNWSKAAQRTERMFSVMVPGGQVAKGNFPAASCPRSAAMIFDLRKRGPLGKLLARAVIEVQSLVRLDRFAAQGFDDQPVCRLELESLFNGVSRRAAEADAWHLLILFSPTGWAADAVDFACGKGRLPFSDRLLSVALFDHGEGRFLWAGADEKLASFQEAFSTDLDEATLGKVQRFLQDYFALNDSISLDALIGQLGISRRAGVRAMKWLAFTGRYGIQTLDEVGMVLTAKP